MIKANGWLKKQDLQLFYNEIQALENAGSSAFQLQEATLKSDKIDVTNCVSH